jgi:hypothetical protein
MVTVVFSNMKNCIFATTLVRKRTVRVGRLGVFVLYDMQNCTYQTKFSSRTDILFTQPSPRN